MTDDANPQSARVPVPIEAIIRPAVAVNPSPMMMPSVAPGESITRPLIVHGNAPFHILSVKCGDKRFQCVPPSAANLLHRLPVTFTAAADEKPGRVSTTVRIATDAPGNPTIDVVVSVEIAAAATSEKPDEPAPPPNPLP